MRSKLHKSARTVLECFIDFPKVNIGVHSLRAGGASAAANEGVMSQSIPTGYIPPGKFFERANPSHPGKFFCLIPCPGAKSDGQIPRGWGKIFTN